GRIVNALKNAKNDYWATEVEVERLSAAAWTAYAKGNRDEALTLMRSAAEVEEKSEKSAVTPGRLVPARELLGEMLLELKRSAEALKEFEASERHDPNRFRGIYGAAQAAAESGDNAKAKRYSRDWWISPAKAIRGRKSSRRKRNLPRINLAAMPR